MLVFYLVVLALGAALLLWRVAGDRADATGQHQIHHGDDVNLPGTRVGGTEEYLGQGGVGGVEGEAHAPGFHAAADGGIGGAEGETEGDVAARWTDPARLAAVGLAALGVAGAVLSRFVAGLHDGWIF